MEYDEDMQDSMFAYSETKQKIVHISEIDESQRKLPYTCPKCKQKMIAALGDKNIHHFRHYAKTNCTGSLESAIHQFAKEVLARNMKIRIPEQYLETRESNGYVKKITVVPEQMLAFDNIETEVHMRVLYQILLCIKMVNRY